MTELFLFNGNGLKSIPLQSLPASSWKYVVGNNPGEGDLLALLASIPWMARSLELLGNAITELPFAIHEGDEGGDELKKADWPFQINMGRLFYALYQDYKVFGRSYCFIDKSILGTVRTDSPLDYLRRWLPTSVEPKFSDTEGLIQFIRKVGSKSIPITPDQVVYWPKPPLDSETGWGKSSAESALKAAGILDKLDTTLDKYWHQGAVNSTLISVEGSIQEADKERVQSWIDNRVAGIRNAFKSRVISGKLSSVTLGYPMKELAATELTNSKREDVATAMGIPHSLLFSNAANFATANADKLNLYDHTINPDSAMLEELLNEKVFNPLGYHLKFHPERMEIYQQQEASKASAIKELRDSDTMSRDEARQFMNLPLDTTDREGKMDAQELRGLQFQLTGLAQAVTAGASLEQAAEWVGLKLDGSLKEEKKPAPQQTPMLPPPQQTPVTTVTPAEGETTADNSVKALSLDDLRKWQSVAVSRFNEGHLHKALTFKSDVIPPAIQGAIRGALQQVDTDNDIKRVFDYAARFPGYL